MIWWFYGSLKEYKLALSPQQAKVLRARFDQPSIAAEPVT